MKTKLIKGDPILVQENIYGDYTEGTIVGAHSDMIKVKIPVLWIFHRHVWIHHSDCKFKTESNEA